MNMTLFQKRWIVAILYYINLISLMWIAAAHVLSFWNTSLANEWVLVDMIVISVPIFFASALHRRDRLYVARFGEKRRFYTMLNATSENIGRDNEIMMDFLFRYIATSPTAIPYAPRWLVWFCWVMFLVTIPYGWFQMCASLGLPIDILIGRTSIELAAVFFYNLPILYSWQRELVIEQDA